MSSNEAVSLAFPGETGRSFPLWLMEVLKPAILVDTVSATTPEYLEWCRAIDLLGLETHAYSVEAVSRQEPHVIEETVESASFASFSHAVSSTPEEAAALFPDGAVDLLVLDGATNVTIALVETWLPRMSASGVVMFRSTGGVPAGGAVWEALSARYPSMMHAVGGHRMLLVGAEAPLRVRDLFGPQDRREATEAMLSDYTVSPSGAEDALHQLAERLSAQAAELDEVRRALAEKDEILSQVRSAQQVHERKVRALTRALESADVSSQATLENLEMARREVSALLGSRSWTVTAPLRGATIVLRYTRRLISGSVRYARGVPGRIAARGWKQALREVASVVFRPRHALARLQGHAGASGEPEPVYKLLPPPAATGRLAQRVLIIAEMSLAQCLKYRVLQKQRMILDLGIDCTVVSWHDVASARDYLQTHTMAIFYRVPGFPPQLETMRIARTLGVPTFWEVDDLIFDEELYKTNSNLHDLNKKVRESIMNGVPLYRAAMLACDGCIASTQALADVMYSAGAKQVHIIENALDDETMRIAEEINMSPRRHDGLVRIVYGSGSASHDTDFKEASAALLKVLKSRYDTRLTIIGSLNLPPEFHEVENQIERLPPSDYETYMKRLARCHVSIAPLEKSIFNDAKSNIKYLEAAILGLPSVCSATMEYSNTVTHGETGFLASTPKEWEDHLTRLVDDASLRARIGNAALAHVTAHYTPEVIARERVEPVLLPYRKFKKDKLRVLAANIFFEPRSFGGATIVAEQVARRINAGGEVDYAMLTSLPTSDVHPYKIVRYQTSAAEAFAMGLPFEGNPAFDFDNPFTVFGFREILRSWKPDVVHLHSIQGFGVQIAEVCLDEGVPFIVTAHDAWWICARQFMITKEGKYCHQRKVDINVCASCVVHPALNPYRQFRLREILLKADRLVVPSAFFRGLYMDNGFAPEKTIVNKNGVVPPRRKAERTAPSTRPLRFGFVGGEGPAKGSELIKQVLREMPEHTNYELLVVDGALNLGRRVIFENTWHIPGTLSIVPAYTQDTIDDFFEGVDVLLFPTQCKESFGLSVREAMIRDVWVVATDAGGAVEDIVPGENGDVVPLEDDGKRFKEALRRLLENPGKLDGYRNRHVDMIRVFDEQARELTGMLKDVAKRNPVIEAVKAPYAST